MTLEADNLLWSQAGMLSVLLDYLYVSISQILMSMTSCKNTTHVGISQEELHSR